MRVFPSPDGLSCFFFWPAKRKNNKKKNRLKIKAGIFIYPIGYVFLYR